MQKDQPGGKGILYEKTPAKGFFKRIIMADRKTDPKTRKYSIQAILWLRLYQCTHFFDINLLF